MNEQTHLQYKFRRALSVSMANYLSLYPQLSKTHADEFAIATKIISYANNMNYTPILIWRAIDAIEKSLPRPFYMLFQNQLGNVLRGLLTHYPVDALELYFSQEQYETAQRLQRSQDKQLLKLNNDRQALASQLEDIADKLKALKDENARLKQKNAEIENENMQLKAQLEKYLSDPVYANADTLALRDTLSQTISQQQEVEKKREKLLETTLQEKDKFFEMVQKLSVENDRLKQNNHRLVEVNSKLLKENLELSKTLDVQPEPKAPVIETSKGYGFFTH